MIPNYALVALNLIYQPEWTRVLATGAAEQESTIGAALAAMAQIRPDVLLGGEARYLRKYEGIGLDEFSGQALFVGPTAYFQLSAALAADGEPGAFRPGDVRPDRAPRSISSISSATRPGWCSGSISSAGVPTGFLTRD